jgi:hypothetical protein
MMDDLRSAEAKRRADFDKLGIRFYTKRSHTLVRFNFEYNTGNDWKVSFLTRESQ